MAHLPVYVWLVLSTIWGSTWLFIKLGLNDIPPFTLVWTRFAVACIPLLLLSVKRHAHWPRSSRLWGYIFGTGVLQFLMNYPLVYWGETLISSGLAAILFSTLPLVGGVLAHFMLTDEPLILAKALGAVLGLIAVSLIFSDDISLAEPGTSLGAAAILLAVLCSALSGILIKKQLRQVDPVILTLGQILSSLPFLIGLGLIVEGSPFQYTWTLAAMGGMVYLAVFGSAFSFVLLNWLYRHMPVTKTQFIPMASTLIALLLGWAVRGETLGWRALLGAVLIVLGLFLGAIRRRT